MNKKNIIWHFFFTTQRVDPSEYICDVASNHYFFTSTSILMVSNAKYIERALLLASLSEHKNFKHGALLVKRGKIMGEAMNTYTKSPSRHPNYKSEHAEINVMNSLANRPSRDMRGSVMFVARSNSLGSGFSQPCARCENQMRSMGIFKVVYTTSLCGETKQVRL